MYCRVNEGKRVIKQRTRTVEAVGLLICNFYALVTSLQGKGKDSQCERRQKGKKKEKMKKGENHHGIEVVKDSG